MKIILVLITFLPLQMAIAQDQKSTTKAGILTHATQDKSTIPEGINRSAAGRAAQNDATTQTQSDNRIYPIKIVSQPANPTDPWIVISVLISGFVALIACVGLAVTRKQLRLEQRAWVGIYKIHGKLKLGKPFVITIVLKNTGKSPACQLRVVETSMSLKRGETISFVYPTVNTEPTAALLMPGSLQRIRKAIVGGDEITVAVVDSIAKEDYRYVVHGVLSYRDIFGQAHWLRYYFWLAPDGQGYVIGPEHNDTGDGDLPKKPRDLNVVW